ncbi:MAG TPA: 30S ribosomal protein S7 [Candidatus Methylacidiphilales bacterium]|nr:30S ribosomal protein S7 [Candidatus Methylacidiphilales bacterium]
MARRRRAEKRQILPDSRYESVIVGRLISSIMERGKKSLAQRIVYGAIDAVNEQNKDGDPLDILNKALENVKPRLEVKSRRVGGATYQVPMEVPPDRQMALAMRWMVANAAKRKGVPMQKALASEIKEASNGQGNSVKKRDDVHKMAQANRAFAHFRF